jgi:hypothetical protein
MKKLFLAIAILFSLNGKAQDTTYFHSQANMWKKHNDLYMNIRTRVTDTTTFNRYWTLERIKRKKKDKTFVIAVTTIFTTLSVWFISGYHK